MNSSNNWKINMKQQTLKSVSTAFALGAILFLGACHKKAAPPPPPPPPPAPAPTASISVSPDTIQHGQSATLSWQTSNATDVSIDGIGAVQPTGSQQVTPTDSTTYHLTAKGPGGTQDATTRLTITAPVAAAPPPPSPSEEDLFGQSVKDIYFEYDKSDIRSDQQSAIQADILFLNQHPEINFTIEGHCDSRGSTEYNLALGDQRASSVKNALVAGGISANRIKTISYGKEKPFCMEENEACWQQNRRGHFVYQK
ncbi:MAG TPA: peptidoglycan-associated lipoprotein Pal [Candidatus Deferrimicrobiaceae bacterium]|nr:peptidoglycan-associated lipoprotein Pal [Candidatus Deferrimicrobiaceae bacterium]